MKNTADDHVVMEWDQIDDYIIIGTNLCCTVHVQELHDLGVVADIDLEEAQMHQPMDVLHSLWLPTVDHTAPTLSQLRVGAATLTELVAAKQLTYVHCRNGHGRSPTLVAAYYIHQGLAVDAAIEKIASKRSEIHIEPPQIEALEQFAAQSLPR